MCSVTLPFHFAGWRLLEVLPLKQKHIYSGLHLNLYFESTFGDVMVSELSSGRALDNGLSNQKQ
jgi:hypothetical protein